MSKRILLVDDDSSMLFMISRIVEKLGHKAVTCSSPYTAMLMLVDGPKTDLIIFDYLMGLDVPNGVESAKMAKENYGYDGPIIICSGNERVHNCPNRIPWAVKGNWLILEDIINKELGVVG